MGLKTIRFTIVNLQSRDSVLVSVLSVFCMTKHRVIQKITSFTSSRTHNIIPSNPVNSCIVVNNAQMSPCWNNHRGFSGASERSFSVEAGLPQTLLVKIQNVSLLTMLRTGCGNSLVICNFEYFEIVLVLSNTRGQSRRLMEFNLITIKT